MSGKCDLKFTRDEPRNDMANKAKSLWNHRFSLQLIHPRGFAIAMLTLLLLVAGAPMGGSVVASDAMITSAAPDHETMQIFDAQEVIDRLKELLEALEDAKKEVEEDVSRTANGVGETGMKTVNFKLFGHLNSATRSIDDILDPTVEPNLDPVDAGSVESVIIPVSLIQYANTTFALANEALAAAMALNQPLRDEVIGSKLKTIDSLMPGYYSAAGF